MQKNRFIPKLIAIVMTVTVCLCTLAPTSYALVNKRGSITLHVTDSKTAQPFENMIFDLYLFAVAYEKGDGIAYDYTVPYDECKMDMNNLQDAYLPVHLTHFAISNNLPYTQLFTDADGIAVFENLVPGVYLIVASDQSEKYYTPAPFVINIPVLSNEHNTWVYDVNATPKIQAYDSQENEGFIHPEKTYISVEKKWKTDTQTPESITVTLLRDYRKYDTVILSEDNNWTYRWNDLSPKYSWNVVEENVPDGYTVSYETSANTVIILNKKTSETESVTSDETLPSDETTTSPPSEETTKPDNETTTAPDKLIQTGQLNWPVPILSITGLLLFSLGWAMLNLGKKKNV